MDYFQKQNLKGHIIVELVYLTILTVQVVVGPGDIILPVTRSGS